MGRTGRSYLKLFQDETDLRCTVMLDCSGSMRQGAKTRGDLKGSKFQWMQYFATALSHLIVVGRDAVGLCTVREGLETYISPSSSMQQRALIHQTIEQLKPDGVTRLANGLDQLILQAKRRGVLLVLSDFLVDHLDSVVGSFRKFRAAGWEIIALHLVDPSEERLPDGNAFRFIGHERDGEVNCQLAEVRAAYQERFELHMTTTRTALISVGCDYYRIRTTEDYLEVLRSFLVTRTA